MGRYTNELVRKVNRIKLNGVNYWELYLVHACNGSLADNEIKLDNDELLKFYNLVDDLWCKDQFGKGIDEIANSLASMYPLEEGLTPQRILSRM